MREPKVSVIGTRASGERIVISTHVFRDIAEKVVGLLAVGSDFSQIHIEDAYGKPMQPKKSGE